jgi:uncharacterized protein (DUF1330 family)
MPAYVVFDIEIRDPERYAVYVEQAPRTLELYGGRYLVRGGAIESLEGARRPSRFVVVEFPSLEQARAWWASEEYREPKALRQAAAISNGFLVAGAESAPQRT